MFEATKVDAIIHNRSEKPRRAPDQGLGCLKAFSSSDPLLPRNTLITCLQWCAAHFLCYVDGLPESSCRREKNNFWSGQTFKEPALDFQGPLSAAVTGVCAQQPQAMVKSVHLSISWVFAVIEEFPLVDKVKVKPFTQISMLLWEGGRPADRSQRALRVVNSLGTWP